jgi:hypothetical protein
LLTAKLKPTREKENTRSVAEREIADSSIPAIIEIIVKKE